MKKLFIFVFIARILFPMSPQVYKNVLSFTAENGYYVLVLQGGRKVCVPIMWTIIEEI